MRPLTSALQSTPGTGTREALASASALAHQLHLLAVDTTRLRVRAAGTPSLQEATAALHDLACQAVAEDGERLEARRTELSALMSGLASTIQPATDGPYLVTNVSAMRDWLGVSLDVLPQAALCRCGASMLKPWRPRSPARVGSPNARPAPVVGCGAERSGWAVAFTAYLEWGSRIALENSQPGIHPPPHMPVPRWWWVCDAYPWSRPHATADTVPDPPALQLPEAAQPLSYQSHIKPLFRDRDRDSMRFAFDLFSHDDVSTHADAILARLQAGTMPCDGAWPAERVAVFQRWLTAGRPA